MNYPVTIAFLSEELIYGILFVLWIAFKVFGSLAGNKKNESPEDEAQEQQRAEDIIAEIRRKMDARSSNRPAEASPTPRKTIQHNPVQRPEVARPVQEIRPAVQPYEPIEIEQQFDYEDEWNKQQERLKEIKQSVQNIPVSKVKTPKKTSHTRIDKNNIRKRLKDPNNLREAIVLNEILGRPKSESI